MHARLHHHRLPGPAPGGGLPARGAADLVLRGAAHLGEAEGGDRGRHRGRAGRRQRKQATRVGARRRACRRCGSSRPARRSPTSSRAEYAKADELVLSKIRDAARARPGRVGERRRGAHAARGDRVLPRDRHPAGRAVGHVRDLRLRRLQPARAGSRSARSGRPAPGAEIKLADDGEVLIRGPIVMPGYRNQPDKTARGDRRRRLAAHRRHRRVRRGRLPEDRRPQEGADHQRGAARTCRRPTSRPRSRPRAR